ncbi:hypothetical protein AKJ16_DCAP06427 [Drosera capensis]
MEIFERNRRRIRSEVDRRRRPVGQHFRQRIAHQLEEVSPAKDSIFVLVEARPVSNWSAHIRKHLGQVDNGKLETLLLITWLTISDIGSIRDRILMMPLISAQEYLQKARAGIMIFAKCQPLNNKEATRSIRTHEFSILVALGCKLRLIYNKEERNPLTGFESEIAFVEI